MSLQNVQAHFMARLTNEQFRAVETRLTGMGEYFHKS